MTEGPPHQLKPSLPTPLDMLDPHITPQAMDFDSLHFLPHPESITGVDGCNQILGSHAVDPPKPLAPWPISCVSGSLHFVVPDCLPNTGRKGPDDASTDTMLLLRWPGCLNYGHKLDTCSLRNGCRVCWESEPGEHVSATSRMKPQNYLWLRLRRF